MNPAWGTLCLSLKSSINWPSLFVSNGGTGGVSGDLSLSFGTAIVGNSGAVSIGCGSSASGSGGSIAAATRVDKATRTNEWVDAHERLGRNR